MVTRGSWAVDGATITGRTVAVTYGEGSDLDVEYGPLAQNFFVCVDSVSVDIESVLVDAAERMVLLTVGQPIEETQAVVVTYASQN